jgi:hypothetical protein
VLAVLLLVMTSTPDGDAVELNWRAPASCPGPDDVREWIAAQASEGAIPLVVDAEVQQRVDHYELVLELRGEGPATSRVLAHADCLELARATAFIVSVARDPIVAFTAVHRQDAPSRVRPRERAPVAELEPEVVHPVLPPLLLPGPSSPVVATSRARPRRRPAPRPRDPYLGLAVEGAVGIGAVPKIDGTIGGLVVGGAPRFRVMAGVLHTFEQRAEYPELDGVGASVWITRAVVRGCGRFAAGRLALQPCVGLEAGVAAGRGFGVPVVYTRREPWVAANVATALEIALGGGVAMWLAPTLVVPFRRPAFGIRDAGDPVWRIGRLVASLHLGLVVRLPVRRSAPDAGRDQNRRNRRP